MPSFLTSCLQGRPGPAHRNRPPTDLSVQHLTTGISRRSSATILVVCVFINFKGTYCWKYDRYPFPPADPFQPSFPVTVPILTHEARGVAHRNLAGMLRGMKAGERSSKCQVPSPLGKGFSKLWPRIPRACPTPRPPGDAVCCHMHCGISGSKQPAAEALRTDRHARD